MHEKSCFLESIDGEAVSLVEDEDNEAATAAKCSTNCQKKNFTIIGCGSVESIKQHGSDARAATSAMEQLARSPSGALRRCGLGLKYRIALILC